MLADLALSRCLKLEGVKTVLDVGSGSGDHAAAFRSAGFEVTTLDIAHDADVVGDFLTCDLQASDLVWCSHVLEHQLNPGLFLSKCYDVCKKWLCVTVPPAKDEIVGGHLTIWNPGLLLYNLILAGFDCSKAQVKVYGYNITVLVEKKPFKMPPLKYDFGDIETLSAYFPFDAKHGFNGKTGNINWID